MVWSGPGRRWIFLALACTAALSGCQLPATPSSSGEVFGVLIADPSHLASDRAAGVTLAVRDLSWKKWEPTRGQMNATYRSQEMATVKQFRAAGMTIVIDLGLNDAPAWATALADGQMRDQAGNLSSVPNFTFSNSVRTAADQYIHNVVNALGTVAAYKIGYSATDEALFPTPIGNGFWAYDKAAQGADANLPSGMSPSPMPGWVPTASTWNGQSVTNPQVANWYSWYTGSLARGLNWEMQQLQSAGHTGMFEVAWPGDGANPWVYQHRLTTKLAATSSDPYATMNAGAAYPELLDQMAPGQNVLIDISSVGDHSGSPADNGCQTSDDSVDYQTDATVNNWSSTRWLSYLARRHDLGSIGESTGQNDVQDMTTAFASARSCNLIGLQWAFDYQLYGGQYASITDYASHIAAAHSS
jgi:hypothetical protein